MESFSPEQKRALQLLEQKKNIFITGPAGCGKSFLVQQIRKVSSKNLDVTASTGLAASLIGGMTLHSWAGVGLGLDPKQVLVRRLKRKNSPRGEAWKRCQILLIDEISMITADLFEKLDFIAKSLRNNDRPFGGIQLVLVGDFLQLPPITQDKDRVFCFESKAWQQARIQVVMLQQIFRQKDPIFLSILHTIRKNHDLDAEQLAVIDECSSRELKDIDDIKATTLYSKRVHVDEYNQAQLAKLPSDPKHIYRARDSGLDHLFDKFRLPSKLELRVGAQVLFLVNDPDHGLVNGSRGIVIAFDDKDSLPIVRFENKLTMKVSQKSERIEEKEKLIASRTQIPLCLAWALTIHKSQGMTLQRANVNVEGSFENGQVYVAMSRVESLEGLRLQGFHPGLVRAHTSALKFYEQIK